MNVLPKLILLLADAAPSTPASPGAAGQQTPAESMVGMLGMLLPLGIIFYLMIWRPESKRRKQREQTLNAVKVKDRVVTIGGMYGTVLDIEKDEVVLLVDPKKDIKLRFRRSAIDAVDSGAAEEKK